MTAAQTGTPGRGQIVLAVDGGNAKTDLALVDSSGRLLALVRGPGSSAHTLGIDGCIDVIESLLQSAVARAGLRSPMHGIASAAYILLAGADLPEERSALTASVEQLNWSARPVVDNDTLALLRAGTDRGWGVAVVCGAGINCLGVAPDGREVRFPSLGEISGDWGGGADVGLAALAAAARSADARGPTTVLETAVPAYFGFSEPVDVSRALHFGQVPGSRLRELAPLVLALSDGDAVAAGIVHRLTDEVIAFAQATLRRLDLTATDPDVVLGGGVLRALPAAIVQNITLGVHAVAANARVLVSASEPIVGAALLGLDALGADPQVGFRVRAELDAAARAFVSPEVTARDPRSSSRPRPARR